jgi:hypothetical protein
MRQNNCCQNCCHIYLGPGAAPRRRRRVERTISVVIKHHFVLGIGDLARTFISSGLCPI